MIRKLLALLLFIALTNSMEEMKEDNTKITGAKLTFYSENECKTQTKDQPMKENMDMNLQTLYKTKDESMVIFPICGFADGREMHLYVVNKGEHTKGVALIEPLKIKNWDTKKAQDKSTCVEAKKDPKFWAGMVWNGACTKPENSVALVTSEDEKVKSLDDFEKFIKDKDFSELVKEAEVLERKTEDENTGLGAGPIAGIVIGSLAGVALLAGLAWYCSSNKN